MRKILHAHAPSSLRGLGAEHVLMSGAYGVAAALAHHPVGSAAVAVGYATVGAFAVRDQRRRERADACTGRHAAGCPLGDGG